MRAIRSLTAVAALVVAGTIAASTTASAAHFGVFVGPGDGYREAYRAPEQCWRWSPRWQHWVWACRPGYPQYQYAPAPSLGFYFGFGGDRYHRDHR